MMPGVYNFAGSGRPFATAMTAPYRRNLLGYTALVSGTAAWLLGTPQSALAACTVTAAPNIVTCASSTTTTDTTNTNAFATSSSDREQLFTAGAGVLATVNPAITIDGYGLAITNTQVGANGNVVIGHGGSITLGSFSNAAFKITSTGGTVTYSGNGAVSDGGQNTRALFMSGASVSATVGGTVSGSEGIRADVPAGAGTVTVTNTAAVTGINTAIEANGIDGLVTVNGQGAITGSVGIAAFSDGTGGATVATTAAGTINATNVGIGILSQGTGGSISVTTGGAIDATNFAGQGISARITNAANAGTVGVHANANVTGGSVSNSGILALSNGTGAVTVDGSGRVAGADGIVAIQNNNAVGTNAGVHVGGTGATAAGSGGAGTGIFAQIAGANNAGNILVDRSGTILGFNSGIVARTAGAGSVTVTTASDLTSFNRAIRTSATTGLTTITVNGGTVQGRVGGAIDAASAGTVIINNNATIQNRSGLAEDSVVQTSAAAATINNAQTMTGTVSMVGGGINTINNSGTWNTRFDSTFVGASAVNNSGTINVANAATFGGSPATLTNQAGGILNLAGGASPGRLTLGGNMVFQTGSSYAVLVNPMLASQISAGGFATLAGTVQATFLPGSYLTRSYDILTSSGRTGAFNGLTTTNLPAGFVATLSYTPTDVLLNLTSALPSSGFGQNQQNVANAINNFFNTGGTLPPGFLSLFGLAGPALSYALTQASGETATGSQQTTFSAMNQFLGLLLDPFIDGRGDNGLAQAAATPYADEDALAYGSSGKSRSKSERDAYAAIYRKAPLASTYNPRWSVWAAGFGGSQTTEGTAALGSNNTTSRIFGVAAGADYIFSPRTIAGFALAGGGTNFSVANGGRGRSDLFQAGAFIKHKVGAAYISGALAYGWQDITTDRTVTIAVIDRLRAQFNANAFSGRVESGYRFVSPWIGGLGITPYAAGQFTTFDLPAYAESVVSGANTFALAYGSKSVTATRSELGFRADKSFAMQTAILTLRGRAAWAHDFNPDRTVGATFQTLPGASFVVNGARQASDAALTTASADIKWMNGWSAAATFEGEFSDVSRSYAGKGVVRYQW
jgi:uncharacterized protein with beta-barrel porin domain